jgi:hypothetical protein
MASTSAGRSATFLALWWRWIVWMFCVGVGFGVGSCLVRLGLGDWGGAFFGLVATLLGYAIMAPVIALPIAGIARLFPHIRIWPTTLAVGALRVVVIFFFFGVWTGYQYAHPAAQARASSAAADQVSAPVDDRSICLAAYDHGKPYKGAFDACRSLAFQVSPQLQAMARSGDPRVVLKDSWDLLRITYVVTFAYQERGEPESARQSALHCAGWGYLAYGAITQLDPKGRNAAYRSQAQEIVGAMRRLDAAFPGVLAEEQKAFKEMTQ